MSKTPRTDAFITQDEGSLLEFARTLERELAHALRDQDLFKSDTPNKEQVAILDVINALRCVVIRLTDLDMHCFNYKDGEALLNLLADAEAKLQLP